LQGTLPIPFVEVNPDDASKLGLNADGFARVSTAHGSAVLRVKITAAQVHACFGVKSQAILSAIADGARSTEAIGAQLNAGTNCGSCLPELRRMIAAARAPQKAKADLSA
jgi:NAD(P)H-nitrite reductase large subunit